MKFRKGESGNPAGRPKGSGVARQLREAIESDLREIVESMVEAAKGGDVAAAKLLLDRAIPALKPTDTPVRVGFSGGLAANSQQIIEAVGIGVITPDQGTKLLQGLGAAARVEEVSELKDRLLAVEKILNHRDSVS